MARAVCGHPRIFGVVAEAEGRVVGRIPWTSGTRSPPSARSPSIRRTRAAASGRRLMQAVIDRARERRAPGVRLVQDAFNRTSMSLHVPRLRREGTRCVMQGTATGQPPAGPRPPAPGGRPRGLCGDLRSVHGSTAPTNCADAIRYARPRPRPRRPRDRVRLRDHLPAPQPRRRRDRAGPARPFDRRAGTLTGQPTGLLLPTRQSSLLRWRWRAANVKPMTLMAMGEYREPRGAGSRPWRTRL